jgi:hypothetical protein
MWHETGAEVNYKGNTSKAHGRNGKFQKDIGMQEVCLRIGDER